MCAVAQLNCRAPLSRRSLKILHMFVCNASKRECFVCNIIYLNVKYNIEEGEKKKTSCRTYVFCHHSFIYASHETRKGIQNYIPERFFFRFVFVSSQKGAVDNIVVELAVFAESRPYFFFCSIYSHTTHSHTPSFDNGQLMQMEQNVLWAMSVRSHFWFGLSSSCNTSLCLFA